MRTTKLSCTVGAPTRRRRSGRCVVALAATATLALGVAACGDDEDEGGSGEAGGVKTVKLFGMETLSGPSSAFGIAAQQGEEMAVEEINAAGGVTDESGQKYKVELEVQDMATKQEAIALMQQASRDSGVLAVVGVTASTGFVPVVPLAAQVKMPVVATQPAAPIEEWNPYVYRIGTVSAGADPAVLKTVVEQEDVKRFAVIYDQTQDSQVGDADQVKQNAAELGYEVVEEQAYSSGDQDFSAQLTAIKAADPDALWVAAQTQDMGGIVRQVKSLGIDAALVTGFGAFGFPEVWDTSEGGVKDGYTWIPVDLQKATGKLAEFVEKFKQKHPDNVVTSQVVYGYDAVYTAMEAVRLAGTSDDREAFQKALSNLEYTTPIGTTVKFENPPTGENLNPTVTVIQVTGRGEYTAVGG